MLTGARARSRSGFSGAAVDIPGAREMVARLQRVSASPSTIRLHLHEAIETDVRDLLSAIQAPTRS